MKRLAVVLVAVLGSLVAVGAPHAEGSSNGSSGGWLVFTRFDPAIGDDATFLRHPDGSLRRLFPGGSSGPHWSPDGELVSIAACADPPACQTAAVLVDPDTRDFTALPMPAPTRVFTSCLIWRPDGKRLACEGFGEPDPSLTGVYTISVNGGDLRRLTWNPGGDDNPLDYSDDGTRLLFTRTKAGQPEDSAPCSSRTCRRAARRTGSRRGDSPTTKQNSLRVAEGSPSSIAARSTSRIPMATPFRRSGWTRSRVTARGTSPGRQTASDSPSCWQRRSRTAATEKALRPHSPTAPTSAGSPPARPSTTSRTGGPENRNCDSRTSDSRQLNALFGRSSSEHFTR